MDDLDEIETEGIKKLGKYCFVSSWSYKQDEDIAMWERYGDNMKGVRLKLHTHPFETYTWDSSGIKGAHGVNKNIIFTKSMYTDFDFIPIPVPEDRFIVKINYDNDPKKIYPNVFRRLGNRPFVDFDIVGRYKAEAWDYQKEVRYRIFLLPFNYYNLIRHTDPIIALMNGDELSVDYLDFRIKTEYFHELEITKGPKISDKDSQRIDEIVNHKFTVFDSAYKGRIK